MRALLVLLALSVPLSAQEVWVDAVNGSDTNPGTVTAPLKSITVALSQVTPNSTIYVRPGTYSLANTNEQFPLQFGNGLAHDGVTLYGFPGAVIDLANGRVTGIQIGTQANGGRITGITIANGDKNDWWARAISAGTYNGLGSATGFEIDRCRFIDVNRGIVLWQGVPIIGWRIHDNLFLRLGNDGINEFDTASANQIHDNTFVTGPHLGVLSDADQTLVVSNIFTGLRVGVASSGSAAAATGRVRSNDFWQNTVNVEGAAFPGGTVPSGNLLVDPLFVNAAADDYHLQPQSLLVETGDLQPFQRGDLDNVPGAVDANYDGLAVTDIGAYEVTPITVTATGINGVSLTYLVTSSASNVTLGIAIFGFDEGLITLPGLSPILIDPNLLIVPAFTGPMPFGATLLAPPFPAGFRLIVQGFGLDPTALRLIGGAAVRVQY